MIWALSNCCRGRPIPPFSSVCKALDVFAEVLSIEGDHEMLTDASWALTYVLDADGIQFRCIIAC